jgi:hypothetical protein
VTVANVELMDGVDVLRPGGWPAARRRTLGAAAPGSGFPDLDWTRNADSVTLDFGEKKRRPAKGRLLK